MSHDHAGKLSLCPSRYLNRISVPPYCACAGRTEIERSEPKLMEAPSGVGVGGGPAVTETCVHTEYLPCGKL